MYTATDFFCGMGGSSTGLVEAGFDMKLAANHWDRAIETHAANHPNTEHLCADLQAVDIRYLPKTTILWASPICTEVSPAGGRRKKGHQLDLFEDHGHVPTEAFERTRVTFWEVIRAAEVHRYEVVLIENVVEAADWELFEVWVSAMAALGYEWQWVSASSAHIHDDTNPGAPQWRDRIYGLFWRRGINMPRLELRPLAWCQRCGADVEAVQWWKPGRSRAAWTIGKYGQQYLYVCPVGDHGRVEPYTTPATEAIDWTDVGTRIGDRPRPLGQATLSRVQAGLDLVRREGTPGRAVDDAFIATLRRNAGAKPVSRPLATITGGGFHHALVIPYRRGSTPYRAAAGPLSTMATRAQHGLLATNTIDVEDAHFRMLKPRESANAQRFPRDYAITGNQGEQQMQAGNAVSVNAAHWLGRHVITALDAA